MADDFCRQRANLGIVVRQQHLHIIEGRLILAFCRRQKQREEESGGTYLKERLGGGVLPRTHQSQPIDGKADQKQQEERWPDELQHRREETREATRSQRDNCRSEEQQIEGGGERGSKSDSAGAQLRLVSAAYIVLLPIHDNAKSWL